MKRDLRPQHVTQGTSSRPDDSSESEQAGTATEVNFDLSTVKDLEERLLWSREALAQSLRRARELRGLTQAQLAKSAGVARMTIIRYETADEQQSVEGVEKVLSALEAAQPGQRPDNPTFSKEVASARESLKSLAGVQQQLKQAQDVERELAPGRRPSGPKLESELLDLFLSISSLTDEPKRELLAFIRGYLAGHKHR